MISESLATYLITVVLLFIAGVLYYDFWHRFGGRFDGAAFLEPLKGQIFLTYDDGPASERAGWSNRVGDAAALRHVILELDPAWDFAATSTENLARVLAEFDARAIFFVRGDVLEADPAARDMLLRLQDAHHVIGNHAYSHRRLHELPPAASVDEMLRTDALIQQATGQSASIFRPPYGKWHIGRTLRAWRRPGLKHYGLPVGWTHLSFDWEKQAEDFEQGKIGQAVDELLEDMRSSDKGVIFLQHDVWIYSVLLTRCLLQRLQCENDLRLGPPETLVRHVNAVSHVAKSTLTLGYYLRARARLLHQRFARR